MKKTPIKVTLYKEHSVSFQEKRLHIQNTLLIF